MKNETINLKESGRVYGKVWSKNGKGEMLQLNYNLSNKTKCKICRTGEIIQWVIVFDAQAWHPGLNPYDPYKTGRETTQNIVPWPPHSTSTHIMNKKIFFNKIWSIFFPNLFTDKNFPEQKDHIWCQHKLLGKTLFQKKKKKVIKTFQTSRHRNN